jgi:hypothetical protein
MSDPKPRELANVPPHLNREELEVLLVAVSDLQAGRTVNWDQIRPEYRPFVRRFIKPDRTRHYSRPRPLRRLLRRLLLWKRLEKYPEWIREYVHRVQTFAGAADTDRSTLSSAKPGAAPDEVEEIIFLRDQNKALIKLVAELKAENRRLEKRLQN